MDPVPSPELPNFHEMADYANALENNIRLSQTLPAFNDPNITTTTNKLDELANNVNNIRQDIQRDVTQPVLPEMTVAIEQVMAQGRKALKDDFIKEIRTLGSDLTKEINTLRKDLTYEIHMVKSDVRFVKSDLQFIKDDIRDVKRDLLDVKNDLQAVKKDITKSLTNKINALEEGLKANISAREMNSIARAQNAWNPSKLVPLYSPLTNTEIEQFPETESELSELTKLDLIQLLRELDDPYQDPSYGTLDEKKTRLRMLAGIRGVSEYYMSKPRALTE